jgi:hypothetical protein
LRWASYSLEAKSMRRHNTFALEPPTLQDTDILRTHYSNMQTLTSKHSLTLKIKSIELVNVFFVNCFDMLVRPLLVSSRTSLHMRDILLTLMLQPKSMRDRRELLKNG